MGGASGFSAGAKNAGGALSSGGKSVLGAITGPEGQSPEMANIQQGTSVEDVKNAQHDTGYSLESQRALVRALQQQNGLGLQNNAQNMQYGLANQLVGANGVGTQQGAISGLQGAAGMYQNIAQGSGPNPAQSMLNQATGQNVANQAALMAGQRGAGANVGLMARQAAQQGANTQQQAVGQGATMQANQQLNALQGLVGAQQAVGGLGSNLTNQLSTANQAYANQANQMAGQQINATNAATQADLANQGQMQGALQGVNNSNVAAQGSVNAGNVGLSQTHTGAIGNIAGGVMQGVGVGGASAGGSAAPAAAAARGGMVHLADGGMTPMTPAPQPVMTPAPAQGATSDFGQFMNSSTASNNMAASNDLANKDQSETKPAFTGNSLEKGFAAATAKGVNAYKSSGEKAPATEGAARGGLVKAMVSEGEVAVPPNKTSSPKEAAKYVQEKLSHGGGIKAKTPNEKAVKAGNSYENDKIPMDLREGSIVIPRDAMQSGDPVKSAAKFVAQVLAKRKVKK